MNVTIPITSMSYGPDGIAHLENGKTIFVRGAVTGDIAEVEITEDKPTFARGQARAIVQPSEFRIPNAQLPCPLIGTCAGCPLATLSYDQQLREKRAYVVSALHKNAHLTNEQAEALVGECVPSKQQWGYRNKLELSVLCRAQGQKTAHVKRNKDTQNDDNLKQHAALNLQASTSVQKLQLGFHSQTNTEFLEVSTCPLANKTIAKAPKAIAGALRYLEGNTKGGLNIYRVGIRGSVRTKDTQIALWTPAGAFPRAAAAKTLGSALNGTSVVRVLSNPGKARKIKGVEVLSGKGFWSEELHGIRYFTSAPSFFQVNTQQAETLITTALAYLGDVKDAYVADLYAGGGTFALQLSRKGAYVCAIEAEGSSVRDLQRNAKNAKEDIEIFGGDVGRLLADLGPLDGVIVDPPRAGLAQSVISDIRRANVKKVVYVSCNPQTLARDISRFEEAGFHAMSITPVDMFPQTYHVECIALLSKVKGFRVNTQHSC